MNIKNTNLFGNQSGSSRIARIKQDELNKVKSSYPNGYLVKNETEQNSRMTALSRMRNSGYIIPRKFAYYGGRVTFPYAPKNVSLTVISTSQILVAFTSPNIKNTNYTVTSNLGDVSTGVSSPITVSELLSNTIYTFTVTATNIIGSASITSSSEKTTKPDAPTIISSTILSPTSVSINFIAPSGNGIITQYKVSSNPGNLIGIGTSSPITVSGLTANTAYTFSVTATNSGGTSISSSSVSRGINSSITTPPDSPSIVIATVISANIVNIHFIEQIGTGIITSYTVTSNLGDVSTGVSSPISVLGLISNTSYTFCVSATNSGGTSLQSNESIPVTTRLSIPNAPIIGKAKIVSDNEISVAFIEPNILPGTGMITHYTVTSNLGDVSTCTSSPISIIGLPSNTYIFTVTATNMDGTSLPSGESNIITTTKTEIPIISIVSVLSSTEISVGFTISRGTELNYTVISSPGGLIGTGSSSPITVSGLSSNTEYTFMVSATNRFGSASSDWSSLVITKPDSPTIDSISVLSSTEVSVDFTVPSGTGIINNYTVISNPKGLIGTGSSSPITVSGLSSNTEYTFTVVATNSGGTSKEWCPQDMLYRQVSVTTKPESPMIDTVSVLNSTEVNVIFTSPSGTGIINNYTVISSPGGLIGTGSSSPITVSGLTSNTEYTFTAISTNSGGISISSDVSYLVTTKPESPIIGIISVLSSTEVAVSFIIPNGSGTITEYIVTSNLGDIGIGASSPITVSGLLSNTEYTFTVSATNSGGTSISSSLSSAVTTAPEPPNIGVATVISSTEVSVAFTIPNDTVGTYIVTSNPGNLTGTGTSSPITVSGLLSNTLYTFTVIATNYGRTSFASSSSSPVTTKVSPPIINYLMALSSTDIDVAFTPSSSVDGIITHYTATSNPGNLTGTGTTSPITVSGLTENTNYTFIVSAIRHIISRKPVVLSVSTESCSEYTMPGSPELGIVTVLNKTSVSVVFTQSSKGDGMIINYTATSSPDGLIGTGTTSPITITGLTPYKSYTFTVSATNYSGTSIQSSASDYISLY